jgi:hypothetical protein
MAAIAPLDCADSLMPPQDSGSRKVAEFRRFLNVDLT